MRQYLDLLKDVRANGVLKSTRAKLLSTGKTVDALSVFGRQMRFDLRQGFPLVTTKFTSFDAIVHELIWFLSGLTNIKYLVDNGVNIWNQWCDSRGELGPVYGAQWRSWKSNDGRSIDQIRRLVDGIWHVKSNPESSEGRRLILSAWNVGDLPKMALPPCHMLAQFNVTDGRLSCMLTQRSCDLALGCPYNIASYSLLTCILAHTTGLEVGEFIHSIGDAHLYCNHLDLVDEQLKRKPFPLPNLFIRKGLTDIDDLKFDDIVLVGYKNHPKLRGEVAI
jgi:thymidylate synthase